MTHPITPFRVAIADSALTDLRNRLKATRWPEQETAPGWSQGVPLSKLQALVEHWHSRYDWRRAEAQLNAFPQFRTEIDGLGIHFLHVRSKHEKALPILLTHGWPGSIFEFLKVIAPLTDPTAFGGKAEEAFHVVVPSLPGYGFSDKPTGRGWNAPRTAQAWGELMRRLGYSRWVAQGGDWGAAVTTVLGHLKPSGLAGIHLNWPLVFPEQIPSEGLSAEEKRAVEGALAFGGDGGGFSHMHSTRPQTLGYALADSPVGQAAWIYEKFHAWTDNTGEPESALSLDEMLDNITLYWLTNTGASSARYYLENSPSSFAGGRIELPVAASVFPRDIYRAPKSWAKQAYPQLIHWNEVDKGGHFAAFEQPGLFVRELRDGFRPLR
ncbi:epoxide hydrolase family protein [Stigmatella ashevillensis]|uniref:epoxide hydrolase family protein n=1 Tax=Stigmatella ashevillensis TaxID=2995309 RepID=UPI0027D939B6|nr:epoxide hydrolase [Stigmatella ashevillena]